MTNLDSRLKALEAGTGGHCLEVILAGVDGALTSAQEAIKAGAEAEGRDVVVVTFVSPPPRAAEAMGAEVAEVVE